LKQSKNIFYFNTGFDEANKMSLPLQEALKDDTRIEYHQKHLLALLSAIRSDIYS
jgi:beta-glucosidase